MSTLRDRMKQAKFIEFQLKYYLNLKVEIVQYGGATIGLVDIKLPNCSSPIELLGNYIYWKGDQVLNLPNLFQKMKLRYWSYPKK